MEIGSLEKNREAGYAKKNLFDHAGDIMYSDESREEDAFIGSGEQAAFEEVKFTFNNPAEEEEQLDKRVGHDVVEAIAVFFLKEEIG